MTPEKLAGLIDRYGTTLDQWPMAEGHAARQLLAASPAARAVLERARTLDALLRLEDDPSVTPERAQQVIAHTLNAAQHRPQATAGSPAPIPPSVFTAAWGRVAAYAKDVRRWLRAQIAGWDDGVWRYGMPMAVALVLGVVVGHATLDDIPPVSRGSSGLEALFVTSQPRESFGL